MKKKELEAFRAKQEATKAAELKAKLDMVRTEHKPTYGRQHRKIGEMVCSTGVKVGYSDAVAKFVLRLDATSGEFIAEHGDTWYISKSRDALKEKMDQVARVVHDLKWTRYINIEYQAEVPTTSSWRNGKDRIDADAKREKNQFIYGISLDWSVVEYSDPISLPGNEDDRYMFREVDEDGNPSSQQEGKRELPAGLVVYTKEREQLLRDIRDAFGRIDKKMVELLGGTPEQVAKKLDSVQGTFLLAAPKEKKS